MRLPPLVLIALAALCGGFAVLYLVARRIENYGIVDIAWSYAFGALAAYYALFGSGWPLRRALLAAMAVMWSIRLGTHLLVRIARHHPTEDARYAQLRRDWSANFAPRMFGFFQLQALSVVVLGAAFLLAARNPEYAAIYLSQVVRITGIVFGIPALLLGLPARLLARSLSTVAPKMDTDILAVIEREEAAGGVERESGAANCRA